MIKKPIIVGFYGYSNSGKTTLIERLIKELASQGKKVAAIKQSVHPVSLDIEGKDTHRFSKAGADPVILSSTIETDFMFNKPLEINEIIELTTAINKPDIIIIESARDAAIMKIRIGDIDIRENTIWTYDGNFECIDQKNIEWRQMMYKVTIKVNGKDIYLTDFPTKIITNILLGILESLKEVEEIKDAVIELKTE